MSIAAKPRCAVVFLMVLTLGVSLRLPAEDVLETDYESEALPYEVFPLFSGEALQANGRTPHRVPKLHSSTLPPMIGRDATTTIRVEQGANPVCDSLTVLDHSFRC